jgi:hypothetical protein
MLIGIILIFNLLMRFFVNFNRSVRLKKLFSCPFIKAYEKVINNLNLMNLSIIAFVIYGIYIIVTVNVYVCLAIKVILLVKIFNVTNLC